MKLSSSATALHCHVCFRFRLSPGFAEVVFFPETIQVTIIAPGNEQWRMDVYPGAPSPNLYSLLVEQSFFAKLLISRLSQNAPCFMGNKKRKKRSHSPKSPRTADAKLPRDNSANMNSPDGNALSPITLNAIMETLASLGDKMDCNFKQLREEMESFKHDLKAEIQPTRPYRLHWPLKRKKSIRYERNLRRKRKRSYTSKSTREEKT